MNNYKRRMTEIRKWRHQDKDFWMSRGHDELTATSLVRLHNHLKGSGTGEIITKSPDCSDFIF
jgi:hypothetical protein